MHEAVMSWIGQFRSQDDVSVLDIGGRDLNGSPRMFFPNADPYHVMDLYDGPNVDIVADATGDWKPGCGSPGAYDLVICTEVFEHAANWRDILATAWAALRPGGWLLFTCAGPGRPVHSGIEPVWGLVEGETWYANVSPEEVREVLFVQGWTEVVAHQVGSDTQGKAVKPIPRPDSFAVPREVNLSATLSRTA